MQHIARRTAGFTAAFAAIALIAVGCSDDDSSTGAGDLTASAKSAVSSATDSAKSGAESATASGDASASEGASGTEGAGAGGETKINTPTGEVTVAGAIYDKYKQAGGETSPLAAPQGPEQTDEKGGKYQEFDGGIIYAGVNTPPHIVWGEIRKAWEADGGPNGQLGYPLSDEHPIANGLQSDFENGNITYIGGQTAVVPK